MLNPDGLEVLVREFPVLTKSRPSFPRLKQGLGKWTQTPRRPGSIESETILAQIIYQRVKSVILCTKAYNGILKEVS
jgi:hypothetical protein